MCNKIIIALTLYSLMWFDEKQQQKIENNWVFIIFLCVIFNI